MRHNAFQTSELIERQEASPMQQEMSVLGVDIAKRMGSVTNYCADTYHSRK